MVDVTSGATGAGAARKPRFSDPYKAAVLGLLLLTYTFNFIDRTIIATIGPLIREDLKLTSEQIGKLGGLYFALLYTILGIPIARLAERANRVRIIAVSLVIWSGFTALCGTAANFATLALYRFGVGVGEAGCSPPSHSVISDYYEPKRRATALSVYSFGIPLGTMFGAVAGGWLASHFGWRLAFVVVGLPGLILALIVGLAVREPPRGHTDVVEHPGVPDDVVVETAQPKLSLWTELKELGAVARTLLLKWPILNMTLGVTIASFGSYGSGQFVPQYFRGAFGLDIAFVGMLVGLVGGFSSGVGTLVGGFMTDWLGKRSPIWYALTPALGLGICLPIYLLAYSQPDWRTTFWILLIPGIFHYTYLAPTFGVVQNAVEPRRRATATALLFFVLNFIALGGGPVFTGALIDLFANTAFAHPTASMFDNLAGQMGRAAQATLHAYGDLVTLHTTAAAHPAAGSFGAVCPGGVAPKGAPVAVAKSCRAALSLATQRGIMVSLCFYGWAALHYLLGCIGLAKHVATRRR